MSLGEKESIQHGLVKYIGDMARAADKITLCVYVICRSVENPSWRLQEVYTRYTHQPKQQIWAKKIDVVDHINYGNFPIKHKDTLTQYITDVECYWDCILVGWLGDYGEPPRQFVWEEGPFYLSFMKHMPCQHFTKIITAVTEIEDRDEDFETSHLPKRMSEICDYIWAMVALY